MIILKEQHDARMKKMNQEFQESKQNLNDSMKAAEQHYEEEVQKAQEEYTKNYEDLTNEKQSLTEEVQELTKEVEELSAKKCQNCIEKKEIIKNLLKKRDAIQRHITSMRNVQIGLETKMNSIFKDENKKGYSPRVLSPLVIQPRAKTSLAKGRP